MLTRCSRCPKPKKNLTLVGTQILVMAALNLASVHSLCPRRSGDVCTGGRWKLSVSRGADNVEMRCGVRCGGVRRSRRSRMGVVRAGTSVLTASRVEEGSGYVRVMGPGKGDVKGMGRVLVLDEFFEFPSSTGVRVRDPSVLLESVIYYCDESPSSSELGECGEVEGLRPRHGVHLYLKSSMSAMKQEGISSCVVETGGCVVLPIIDHVRDASAIVPTTIDDVAVVRVVTGSFGNVSAGPPLHDFVMLDVQMRPGSEMSLPLDSSFGVVIYILEGVGIFEPNRFEEDKAPFYQNEGHGLYIPPSQKQASMTIRTHEWSQLRFILVGAPTA